jgi:hypothetical protein
MSGHASIRAPILAAVIVWLFAGSYAAAQTTLKPGAEQQEKAGDERKDQAPKLLENRREAPPTLPEATAAIDAAKEKLRDLVSKKNGEYEKLQLAADPKGIWTERARKYAALRTRLKMMKQEMSDKLVRIEKAYGEAGNDKALYLIKALSVPAPFSHEPPTTDQILLEYNARRRQLIQANGPNHPVIKELDETVAEIKKTTAATAKTNVQANPDDAQTHIAAMKIEISNLAQRSDALSKTIEREFDVPGPDGERLRSELARLRQMIAGLDAILEGDKRLSPR